MESDEIKKIVEERIQKIVDESNERMIGLREGADRAISDVPVQLKSELEGINRIALTNAIEFIRKGGRILTGSFHDRNYNHLRVDINAEHREGKIWDAHRLEEGRYNVTLIIEKI